MNAKSALSSAFKETMLFVIEVETSGGFSGMMGGDEFSLLEE